MKHIADSMPVSTTLALPAWADDSADAAIGADNDRDHRWRDDYR